MKKVYLFLSAALIATAGIAQTNMGNATMEAKQVTPVKTFTLKDASKAHTSANNKATAWIDYASSYSNLYSSTPYGLIGNNLFPDSTLLADYGTSGFASTWVHGIAQTFDMKALSYINDGINVPGGQSFNIDSVSCAGVYTRVDNNSTDTLVFEVIQPNPLNMSGRSYFYNGGVNTNLAVDTCWMMPIDWSFAAKATPGVLAEYRVLLDDNFYADSTANGLHIADAMAGQTISAYIGWADRVFSIAVSFRPGYTWIPNQDTINFNKNGFWFGSYELNGQGTYPTYSKDDYNVASILPQDVRYNNASSWNDTYIPSYAYMGTVPSFAYEAMAINALIDYNVGVDELSNDVDFSVYPNPSNGEFNINLTAANSGNANLVVRNVVGQTIINKTIAVNGQTKETISLTDYSKGIYFLTVNNSTVKLIVE